MKTGVTLRGAVAWLAPFLAVAFALQGWAWWSVVILGVWVLLETTEEIDEDV